MEKSLIIIDGALDQDSFLRTQLGLSSLFEFRVGGRPYRDILTSRFEPSLKSHTFLWRDHGKCSDLSVGELREWLEQGVPGLRDFKNVFVYPAGVYFEDFNDLTHVIERSAGSPDTIRLNERPDVVTLPVRILDDVNHQHRKLSSVEPDFRWTIKSKVYNLENAADLFSIYRTSTEGRFFNSFEVHGPFIKKTSRIPNKSRREHFVLTHLPTAVRPFFPQPGEQSGDDYSLEYIPCFDLGRHFIHGKLDRTTLKRFFIRLDQYFASCPVKKIDRTESGQVLKSLFIDKVRERFAQFKNLESFAALKTVSKPIWPEGPEHFETTLLKAVEERMGRWNTGELVFSHGDLCLSNILFDCSNGLMKLIDPRGADQESELYLPWLYDLAKLSHSFLGHYELIKNQMFDVTLNEALYPTVRFALSTEAIEAAREAFTDWLKAKGLDLKDIRLAEATLFLSMLPLHQDQPRHQLLMFMQAVSSFRSAQ